MNKKIKIIELLNKIANGKEVPIVIEHKGTMYKYDKEAKTYYEVNQNKGIYISFDTDELNDYVEILEDNTEEIEELNAYKLMESPYMANLLKEQRYDTFMELLKQSEVEIADKLIKLTWAVKEIRKDLNK